MSETCSSVSWSKVALSSLKNDFSGKKNSMLDALTLFYGNISLPRILYVLLVLSWSIFVFDVQTSHVCYFDFKPPRLNEAHENENNFFYFVYCVQFPKRYSIETIS